VAMRAGVTRSSPSFGSTLRAAAACRTRCRRAARPACRQSAGRPRVTAAAVSGLSATSASGVSAPSAGASGRLSSAASASWRLRRRGQRIRQEVLQLAGVAAPQRRQIHRGRGTRSVDERIDVELRPSQSLRASSGGRRMPATPRAPRAARRHRSARSGAAAARATAAAASALIAGPRQRETCRLRHLRSRSPAARSGRRRGCARRAARAA
jgi:hypothetical protein